MIDDATTTMNIPQLIKQAHENAVDKGFYDCEKCGKNGFYHPITNGNGDSDGEEVTCDICNGTGINPNKNIGELLMLIVSELGEALEAHRCGRFADWNNYRADSYNSHNYSDEYLYKRYIKDTFEDEIADVFIRLFDLCGYFNFDLVADIDRHGSDFTVRFKNKSIPDVFWGIIGVLVKHEIGMVYSMLISLCDIHNIPIQKHITAKMSYNKTRPPSPIFTVTTCSWQRGRPARGR